MKKVEDTWKNAWDSVLNVEEIYRGYGGKNVLWCFKHLLSCEKKYNILDIVCGACFYFKFFKKLGFRELCGLEYNEGNIHKSKDLNKDITSLKVIQGDIRDLPNPFEENYFDVVVSLGLVEHFVYPVDIIRKLLKTVKKNGVLILEMPNFRNCFFYSYNLKLKNELPFHLWWGVRDWHNVLKRINGCRLEEIQTGDLWAYQSYLPRLLNKVSSELVNFEIAIENRLFKKTGSLAFYKLRKL